MSVPDNCGQRIVESCEGTVFTINENGNSTDEAIIVRFFMLASSIVTAITSIQNIAIVMISEDMTNNMKYGMNALRCATISGLVNIYLPMAAAYFAAR